MSVADHAAVLPAGFAPATPRPRAALPRPSRDALGEVVPVLNVPLLLLFLSLVWTPMVILWFAVLMVPLCIAALVALSLGWTVAPLPDGAP